MSAIEDFLGDGTAQSALSVPTGLVYTHVDSKAHKEAQVSDIKGDLICINPQFLLYTSNLL